MLNFYPTTTIWFNQSPVRTVNYFGRSWYVITDLARLLNTENRNLKHLAVSFKAQSQKHGVAKVRIPQDSSVGHSPANIIPRIAVSEILDNFGTELAAELYIFLHEEIPVLVEEEIYFKVNAQTPHELAAVAQPSDEVSVFDLLRKERADGTEYWSARDLMSPFGYVEWRKFENAIGRAQQTAYNQGLPEEDHFGGAAKVMEKGRWGKTSVNDFHLSRLGAYLVVMNGDPRKPEIAAAQDYFAVSTINFENRSKLTPQANPVSMFSSIAEVEEFAQGVQKFVDEYRTLHKELAEAKDKLTKNEPFYGYFDAALKSEYAISMQDFAKILSGSGKEVGRVMLFKALREAGYIEKGSFNRVNDDKAPTQKAINEGILVPAKAAYKQGPETIEYFTSNVTMLGQILLTQAYREGGLSAIRNRDFQGKALSLISG